MVPEIIIDHGVMEAVVMIQINNDSNDNRAGGCAAMMIQPLGAICCSLCKS